MYVYIYVYIYVYMYICIYVYMYVYIYMYTFTRKVTISKKIDEIDNSQMGLECHTRSKSNPIYQIR